MEEIIITQDMIEIFKEKYGFTTAEIVGIFDERIQKFYGKKSGEIITGLNNPKYVFQLISDTKKLQDRVTELYEKNKGARKIYNKVFAGEEDFIEMPCDREKLIQFRKRINMSRANFAKLFDLRAIDIESFEEGRRNYLVTKNVDIEYYLDNEKEFYNLASKAYSKGKITKKALSYISSGLGIFNKEGKTKLKYVVRTTRKSNVQARNPEEDNKIKKEEVKKRVKIEEPVGDKSEVSRRKINELRNKAKREEKIELSGGRVSFTARKEFIKRINDLYEKKEPISKEDIEIIKNTIMYNEEMLSEDALKICILGTYKNSGYESAMIITNRFISEIEDKKYKEKLKEFRNFLQQTQEKKIKEKLLKEKQKSRE